MGKNRQNKKCKGAMWLNRQGPIIQMSNSYPFNPERWSKKEIQL